MIDSLQHLIQKDSRLIVGLMSGTSLDGIDAALVRLAGSGLSTQVDLLHFNCLKYENKLMQSLMSIASGKLVSAVEFAAVDFQVAQSFANAARAVIHQAGMQTHEIDLVASHGQTLAHHAPGRSSSAAVRSTWQAGNLGALAALLQLPVIGDFRSADVALGGTGAPLAPYPDYILRRSPTEGRVILNMGGIANLTFLPRAGGLNETLAWDVGPGNMLSDALAQRNFDVSFDRDGRFAAAGTAHVDYVQEIMGSEYFQRSPPKSAGREEFGPLFVEGFLNRCSELGLGCEDAQATALELTTTSIAQAISNLPLGSDHVDRVLVTGGGRHNSQLMHGLVVALAWCDVQGLEEIGEDPDSKEAVDFAVLGNESLFGYASNLTHVTGADRPLVLGSLAMSGFQPRSFDRLQDPNR